MHSGAVGGSPGHGRRLCILPPTAMSPDKRLEGFLYPDTYGIDKNSSARDIVAMMLARFSEVWNQEFAASAKEKNISVRDAVIIASLIEREAQVPEEKEDRWGHIQPAPGWNAPAD